MTRTHRWVTLAFLAALSAGGQAAYPEKPVRIIVGFPAGSLTDVATRVMAPALQGHLKQSVLVENRPGATGAVADTFVARSPADGYTVLLATSATTSTAAIKQNFEMVKSLQPVARFAALPLVLYANRQSGFNTIQDLIAHARQNPGKLNFGSSGNGSGSHFSGELIKLRSGISMVHVPYGGSGPSTNALLANDIQVVIRGPAGTDTRLVPLAVLGTARSNLVPNVASTTELGIPGYFPNSWFGLMLPLGTANDATGTLQKSLANAVSEAGLKDALLKLGLEPILESPADFATFIATELDTWADVIKRVGFKASESN